MKKHIACFLSIVVITVVFCLLAAYGEIIIVSRKVIPPADVSAEEWLDGFKRWALIIVVVAGISSLTWYMLGQWVFKIDNWPKSGKRWIWLLLFIVPIVVIIFGIYSTRHAQGGAWVAYTFYALNGLLCYYLATALCSPSSFKYTPWLARKVWRRAW